MTTPNKPNLADPASVPAGVPAGSTPPARPAGAAPTQGARPQAPVGRATAKIEDDDFLDMQRLENKDPNLHYRFVRADETAINKARRRGYELVKTQQGGVRQVVEGPSKGDGTIRFGDTVLMACPRPKHEARQRAKVKVTASRIGSVTDKARQQAAQIQQQTGHHVQMITDKE